MYDEKLIRKGLIIHTILTAFFVFLNYLIFTNTDPDGSFLLIGVPILLLTSTHIMIGYMCLIGLDETFYTDGQKYASFLVKAVSTITNTLKRVFGWVMYRLLK